jgi:hypothetical protein
MNFGEFFFPKNRAFVMEHFFSKTFPEMTKFYHKKVTSLASPENYLMSIAT